MGDRMFRRRARADREFREVQRAGQALLLQFAQQPSPLDTIPSRDIDAGADSVPVVPDLLPPDLRAPSHQDVEGFMMRWDCPWSSMARSVVPDVRRLPGLDRPQHARRVGVAALRGRPPDAGATAGYGLVQPPLRSSRSLAPHPGGRAAPPRPLTPAKPLTPLLRIAGVRRAGLVRAFTPHQLWGIACVFTPPPSWA